MNHGDVNPSLTGGGQSFIVFAQPSTSAQPSQGSFYYPAARQHLEAMTFWGTLDDLQQPVPNRVSPTHQLPGIGTVGPNQLEARKATQELAEHQLGAIPILNIGGMDHHGQEQSQGIHYNVAFASTNLLARVVTPRPPFSVVFTDWLSIMAALGVGSRPSISRTLGRRVSWTRSQVPSCRHWRKYHHTVPQGGRSWGSMRQDMPPRRTYKTPFTISRRSALRCRPPSLAGGNRGASSSHWASVRSLGYGFRIMLPGYHNLRFSHTL